MHVVRFCLIFKKKAFFLTVLCGLNQTNSCRHDVITVLATMVGVDPSLPLSSVITVVVTEFGWCRSLSPNVFSYHCGCDNVWLV